MTKQEHVPETKAPKPNREQRRHPDGVADQPQARDEHPNVDEAPTKSSHKKKTADKWNQ